ncbi:MAG: substrate-binding domain-containing protein [Defluviitaleaceae bacterium]|nr:substrate-binding domain-containing protein [Defluviitaleaceae bacterium]
MKNKIFIISLMLVGLLLSACAGGGNQPAQQAGGTTAPAAETPGGDAPRSLLIYGIYKAGDQTWFIDEGAAAARAVEAMGGEFIFVDARMSPEEHMNAIENAIANNADGILVCIVDQQLSQATVDRLVEAGIPVVAVDDALEDEHGNKLAPWVGIDAYVIGYAVGEWMANYATANGLDADPNSAVLLLTMDTVSSVVPRTQGQFDAFTRMLPDFPQDRIFRGDYNGETAAGFEVASTLFVANPNVTSWMIMSGNEEGAIGALRALEQAGLDQSSAVVGLGAYLAKDEWNNVGDESAMRAAAWFSAEAIGTISAEMLMNYILHGTEMTMETAVPAIIVTPADYREIMGSAAD